LVDWCATDVELRSFWSKENFAFLGFLFLLPGMSMKPMPIRFTKEQDARLSALAASGEFSKQELVRLAVEKLFERLDAGEEVVVQKILRRQMLEGQIGAVSPKTDARKTRK
jgi:hypothetical protein